MQGLIDSHKLYKAVLSVKYSSKKKENILGTIFQDLKKSQVNTNCFSILTSIPKKKL